MTENKGSTNALRNGTGEVVIKRIETRVYRGEPGKVPYWEQESIETIQTFPDGSNRSTTTSRFVGGERSKVPKEVLDAFSECRLSQCSSEVDSDESHGRSDRYSGISSHDGSPHIVGYYRKRTSDDERGRSRESNVSKSKSQDFNVSTSSDDAFVLEALRLHNMCRENHGSPPLKLNKDLCALGSEWATALVNRDVLEHRGDTPYGENIYCLVTNAPDYNISAMEVVGYWYSENENYSYNQEPKSGVLKSGQFTQMVWRDTKEFGIGKAQGKNGRIIAVAYYDPPGNYIGKFGTQVGQPKNKLQLADKPEKNKKSIFGRRKSRSRSESVGSSSGSDLDSDDEKFAKEGVKVHNDYRTKHGVKKLKMSRKLCKYSKEWAQRLAKEDSMRHRDQNTYGENLYMFWSTAPNLKVKAKSAVDSWYNEIKSYTFGSNSPNSACFHFTQVVWKETLKLGMAYCKSRSNKIYVVANYSPAGNFIGRVTENVLPPK